VYYAVPVRRALSTQGRRQLKLFIVVLTEFAFTLIFTEKKVARKCCINYRGDERSTKIMLTR